MDKLRLKTRIEDVAGVKGILEQNPDLDLNAPVNGRKILADALQAEDTDILKAFLDTGRMDLSGWIVSYEHNLNREQDRYSLTVLERKRKKKFDHSINPVFFAISLRSTAKLKMLAEAGADMSCRTPNTDMNPLMYACFIGSFETIKTVFELGLPYDSNATNKHGKTALQYYAHNNRERSSNRRCGKYRNLNYISYWFEACVRRDRQYYSKNFHFKVMAYLHETVGCRGSLAQCIINGFKNSDYDFPKMHFKRLPFDEPDPENTNLTPFMYALVQKKVEVAMGLLNHGADWKKKDSTGKSAFCYFLENIDKCTLFGMQPFPFDKDDLMDYVKNSTKHDIDIFLTFIERKSNLWLVCKQYFDENGWDKFFLFYNSKPYVGNVNSRTIEHLLPLFVADPKKILEFAKITKKFFILQATDECRREPGIKEFYDAVYSVREELYPICFDNCDLQNIWFMESNWEMGRELTTIATQRELAKGIFEEILVKFDPKKFRIVNRFCKLDDDQMYRLVMNLTLEDGGEFNDYYKALKNDSIFWRKTGIYLPIHLYASRGYLPLVSELLKSRCTCSMKDADLVMLIAKLREVKTADLKLGKQVISSALSKLYAPFAIDASGNNVFHLLPYDFRSSSYNNPLRKLKNKRRALIDALFDVKNDQGKIAFECQMRFFKHHGIRLILKLASVVRLSVFKRLVRKMEAWRPGFFANTIVRKYGHLLLFHAKNVKLCEYFMTKWKIPADCRIASLRGTVYTPLFSALYRNNEAKAELLIKSVSESERSVWIDTCKLFRKKFGHSLKVHWISSTVASKEEFYLIMRNYVRSKIYDSPASSNIFTLANSIETLKLDTESLTKLACFSCSLYLNRRSTWSLPYKDSFVAVFVDAVASLSLPVLEHGRALIDQIACLKYKLTGLDELYNQVPLIRVLRATKPDNTPLQQHCALMKIMSELQPGDAIGSCEVCDICKEEFKESGPLVLLKCKHLFHYTCACIPFEAVKCTQCPSSAKK